MAAASAAAPSASAARDENDPVWIRDMLMANPDQVALLKQQNPRLAEALPNLEEFTKVRLAATSTTTLDLRDN